ncbi:MAG: hypothetical protein PHO00_07555 [bacterium]|nr:hypothetical protein [bacterium]
MKQKFSYFIFILFLPVFSAAFTNLRAENISKPASSLVSTLESDRGRPLTLDERISFGKKKIEMKTELEKAKSRFIEELSRITGLAALTITNNLTKTDNADAISAELEKTTRKKFGSSEIRRIQNAQNAEKEKIREIRKKYAGEFSKITGLEEETIMDYLPVHGL